MRLLLDSNVLLWWIADDRRLKPTVAEQIDAEANDVIVSAVSIWEIEIKRKLGKLVHRGDVALQIQAAGFRPLSVTYRHAHVAGRLPRHHGDPFDRMLVAQAQLERARVVTSDAMLQRYDVHVMWAPS